MQTVKELQDWIQQHPKLSPLLAASAGESDAAHDRSHLLRVALWTMRLAPTVDPLEATAAALLHDLVNLPKDHPERAKASEYSAAEAKPLLEKAGFSVDSIQRISEAILHHSFSRGTEPTSLLGKALQDADRLEALGAIGIMRLFSTGNRLGAKYFHPEDPWAKNRALNDNLFSVDHFFTKLLKLPATFHTPKGREEAKARAAVLENFIAQTATELGIPRS